MPRKKSLYTVREATMIAFNSMPEEFTGHQLVYMTRGLLARPSCMDGNIMRRLRELRNEDPVHYNYEVKDADRSIYKKKPHKVVKKDEARQATLL